MAMILLYTIFSNDNSSQIAKTRVLTQIFFILTLFPDWETNANMTTCPVRSFQDKLQVIVATETNKDAFSRLMHLTCLPGTASAFPPLLINRPSSYSQAHSWNLHMSSAQCTGNPSSHFISSSALKIILQQKYCLFMFWEKCIWYLHAQWMEVMFSECVDRKENS